MREKSEMLVLFMPRSGDEIFFHHTFDYKDNHEQCPSSHSHGTRMMRNREYLGYSAPLTSSKWNKQPAYLNSLCTQHF
jgi:hypothetical protein